MSEHNGFVVAKIGKNAETSTDPNDFIFHSDYNTFKIIREDTLIVALAASTNNQSFVQSHGLGFIPLATAFAKESGKNQVFLLNSDNVDLWGPKLGWTSTGVRFNFIETDINQVIFNFDNSNASIRTVSIRFFLLEKI